VWSLPTVGWLMLCSAWSRRVPFLWAVATPVLASIMISFTDVFPGIEIDHKSVWYTLVFRGLASVAPYSWLTSIDPVEHQVNNPGDFSQMIDITGAWNAFAHANIWIGAAVGIPMIIAAIRLRRWKVED
jgi:ABC-2 type transport system permease protein